MTRTKGIAKRVLTCECCKKPINTGELLVRLSWRERALSSHEAAHEGLYPMRKRYYHPEHVPAP